MKSDIVDLAVGLGGVAYLNLSGFNKPEKSSKVNRYAALLQFVRLM